MLLAIHHAHDDSELVEVFALCRSQLVHFEERYDHVEKISESVHGVRHQIFAMIVMPSIAVDVAAAEMSLDQLQRARAPFTLHNREARLQLPSECHARVALNRTAEASLTVYEADDPTRDS